MRPLARPLAAAGALVLTGSLLAGPAFGRGDGPTRRAPRLEVVGSPTRAAAPRVRSSLEAGGGTKAVAPAATAVAAPGAPPRTPIVLGGFDAIGDIDGTTPADPTGALGDDFYLTAINVSFALFDRAGTPVLGPVPLSSVDPALAGASVFDPKIVYDQYNDTFVLVFLVQEDSPRTSLIVTVAIPNATAGDPATWCTSLLPGDNLAGDGAQWADYPGLGYTSTHVTITTNQFSFPSSSAVFRYAQVLVFPSASLYDCSATLSATVFTGSQTRTPAGIQAATLQPAQTAGAAGSKQFLASFEGLGRSSTVTIWRIKPNATGDLVLKRSSIPVGKTLPPPFGTQGGGGLADGDTFWDAGDDRLVNAFYDADRNRLLGAHTILKDLRPDVVTGSYPEAAIRWYELAPANKLRDSLLVRKGTVGAPEVDVGWPTVATDAAGNLFITYNRASAVTGEFLSAWIAEVPAGTTTTATQVPLAVGQGLYNVSFGPERWGDFNALSRDPLDGALIVSVNQYATAFNAFQQTVDVVRHA